MTSQPPTPIDRKSRIELICGTAVVSFLVSAVGYAAIAHGMFGSKAEMAHLLVTAVTVAAVAALLVARRTPPPAYFRILGVFPLVLGLWILWVRAGELIANLSG